MGTAEKKPARLLLVDDEENVLRSLQRLLFEEDLEILTATSGAAGLDILREKELAVIVSDQKMPHMSGAEFLAQAAKVSPDTVRIILTAYADTGSAIKAINDGGVYRYISKPWNDGELAGIIREAVERYALVRENKRLAELTARQNEELRKWSVELEMYVQRQTIDLSNKNRELVRINERAQGRLQDFLRVLSSMIELRGKTVSSHSNNVAAISVELARMTGLSEAETGILGIAAQLHDIGKIGLPDVILLKEPWDLAADAAAQYRRHSVRGQTALAALEEFNEAGVLIRHHHEAWDGSGFPEGLRRSDIPVGARIIAMADRLDRLAGKAGPGGLQDVLRSIKGGSGKLFDPGLYGPLETLVREKGWDIIFFSSGGKEEMVLGLDALEPGMELSRDLHSGTGLLLLGRGAVLTQANIAVLKRCFSLDPSQGGFFIKVGAVQKDGRVQR
ncbi:MAG: response regulator [Nitrospiraceae bacterium]|nr:response regulator [Nitrospiraceae bacterium]